MPRRDVPQFINGDRCEDGQGNVGYVRSCNGVKGPYLKVCISQGPKTGRWEWPEKFCRRPSIDWTSDGPSRECADCGRRFIAGIDGSGLTRIFCRTCDGFQAATDARRSKDSGPSHAFGSQRPKVYRRTPVDDVEDQIAAATRGQS